MVVTSWKTPACNVSTLYASVYEEWLERVGIGSLTWFRQIRICLHECVPYEKRHPEYLFHPRIVVGHSRFGSIPG